MPDIDKEKSCCFFGHRKIDETEELKNNLRGIIENLIITAEEEIIFLFAFDEEYNPLDCLQFIESDSIPNYVFSFVVEDGKISEIHMIGKSQ